MWLAKHSAVAIALILLQIVVVTSAFPFFDEETKSGSQLSSPSGPEQWLVDATKNWMGQLPDSTDLRKISIPGTHDSGARFGGLACETQDWTISQQLEAGIRFFDIRCRRTTSAFAIHHGPCFQEMFFGDVMNQVNAFLNRQPGEVVLMRIKEEHTPMDGANSFSDIWNNYMVRYGHLFIPSWGSGPPPALGQMRGKVLALRDASFSGYGMSYGSYRLIQDYYKVYWLLNDYPFGSDTVSLPQKDRFLREYIQKARNGDYDKFIYNYLSGAVGMAPVDVARSTNAEGYDEIGPFKRRERVGVLIMDYPGEKLIYRIIKTNFESTVYCQARTWWTRSEKTYAKFKMPKSVAGTVITISGGAYALYVFPKCHRATWGDLRFTCGTNGQWSYTGWWDADAWCHSSNTNQPYLEVGNR